MSDTFDDAFDEGAFDAPVTIESTLPPFDYVAHALSRLPHMYRSGDPSKPTNTEKDIAARLGPANTLGAAMRAVLTQRSIDTAVGEQLSVIGRLVGRKERVANDETERRYCRAQILANKSDGVREDLLTVARAIVPDATTIRATNLGNGAAIYEIQGITVTDDVASVLVDLLGRATSDGVRTIVEYTTGPIANQARWGTGTWSTSQNWSRARNTEQ
jgi:hypothetical protein